MPKGKKKFMLKRQRNRRTRLRYNRDVRIVTGNFKKIENPKSVEQFLKV